MDKKEVQFPRQHVYKKEHALGSAVSVIMNLQWDCISKRKSTTRILLRTFCSSEEETPFKIDLEGGSSLQFPKRKLPNRLS